MSLDPDDIIGLIDQAIEKREERKAWEMWLVNYRNMDKNNFVPFSEFYRRITQPVSIRPTEDILKEVEEIRRKIAQKEGDISGNI